MIQMCDLQFIVYRRFWRQNTTMELSPSVMKKITHMDKLNNSFSWSNKNVHMSLDLYKVKTLIRVKPANANITK